MSTRVSFSSMLGFICSAVYTHSEHFHFNKLVKLHTKKIWLNKKSRWIGTDLHGYVTERNLNEPEVMLLTFIRFFSRHWAEGLGERVKRRLVFFPRRCWLPLGWVSVPINCCCPFFLFSSLALSLFYTSCSWTTIQLAQIGWESCACSERSSLSRAMWNITS